MLSSRTLLRVDQDEMSNENMNAQIVDILRKGLDPMLPNFEDYLRRKYPTYVAHLYSSASL